MDDVLLNKASIIERCLCRVQQEYKVCPELDNFTHLDAIILNLERACQAVIDMAMHIIAENHLGVPQSSADAFHILFKGGKISENLYYAMKGMVGFRNISIHEYQILDKDIVRFVVNKGYQDLIRFCASFGIKIFVENQA